jgi:hypothetical protein
MSRMRGGSMGDRTINVGGVSIRTDAIRPIDVNGRMRSNDSGRPIERSR